MRITEIQLVNFKRFSDLTISDIPSSAKLVLLIGSNGSGKSSVFDAFNFLKSTVNRSISSLATETMRYYSKNTQLPFRIHIKFDSKENIEFVIPDNGTNYRQKVESATFYGRTSFRQVPRLTRTSLGQGGRVDLEKDTDRPELFIDRDSRFENDIEKITEVILREFFRGNKSNEEIRNRYINPINDALSNIFGNSANTKLQLIEIIPPLEGKIAQIVFTKGTSEIHYNYLSAGEKEVFNLLINLLSRKALYQDTIYFFDEIDLHLNSSIQFSLLKEITENWISEASQLWISTHSLGFIEYAKQSEQAVIIDFDDLNFDLPHTLTPQLKDNPEIYEIAVGKEFLPSLFTQMKVYFVENNDRDYYVKIGLDRSVFISANNKNDVFHKVRSYSDSYGIVDRDFLSDNDVEEIRKNYARLFVLKYYSIENYLFHPHNLEEYYQKQGKQFDKDEYIAMLVVEKNKIKSDLIVKIAMDRQSYPYFIEPQYNGKELQKRFRNDGANFIQSKEIQSYLESDSLEEFYKALPMKDYLKSLPQRQNISKADLTKTKWFKTQFENILQ